MSNATSATPGGRLVWAPVDDPGRLDGAWWPSSRDATAQLDALLPLATERLGGIATRVSLNIDSWDAAQPRRVRVGKTLVRLGWFHTLDPNTVTLGRAGGERLTLVVIPADCDATAAGVLLRRLAAAPAWPATASEALDSTRAEE